MCEIIVNVGFINKVPNILSVIKENYEKVVELKRFKIIKIPYSIDFTDNYDRIIDDVKNVFISVIKELGLYNYIKKINIELINNDGVPEIKISIEWEKDKRSDVSLR